MDSSEFTERMKFKSKRNDVYLVEDRMGKEYVMKNFKRQEDMQKELAMLTMLGEMGIKVPLVSCWRGNTIIMQYISGCTLLETCENYEKEHKNPHELIERLSCWLLSFYSVFDNRHGDTVILGDVNFSNFLSAKEDGKNIYGIDFEMCCHGEKEQDIGRMCAFALTYNPAFTEWKISFAKTMSEYFTRKMKLDPNKIKHAMEEKFIQRGIEKEQCSRILSEWQ